MSNFTSAVKAFMDDENGVTAIEYGLVASLIGVAIVTGATALGGKLDAMFTWIGGQLKTS
jgi:pilus assembly protein Flp/PilA